MLATFAHYYVVLKSCRWSVNCSKLFLYLLYPISSLRPSFSSCSPWHCSPQGTSSQKYLNQVHEVLSSYASDFARDRNDWAHSKKQGSMFVTNHSFKVFFRMNKISMCKNLVRNMQEFKNSWDSFPASQVCVSTTDNSCFSAYILKIVTIVVIFIIGLFFLFSTQTSHSFSSLPHIPSPHHPHLLPLPLPHPLPLPLPLSPSPSPLPFFFHLFLSLRLYQAVTFTYYLGRLNIIDELYDEAERNLDYSVSRCLKSHGPNKAYVSVEHAML